MTNKIPNFTSMGHLPVGVHLCSATEFIDRFCFSDYRNDFRKSISDIFDFALHRNARYLFIGGSFVTNSEKPSDLDCIIVFERDEDVPSRTEEMLIEVTKLDIMYVSLEHEEEVNSYIKLFIYNRFRREVGIVQVDLYSKGEEWKIRHDVDDSTFEIIKRAYIRRHFHELNQPKGVLVTIHGLLSTARWNSEITPIANSQGWIVAPYLYETNNVDLLINASKRQRILDDFRDWIYDLKNRFKEYPISIIAHSFGTYIFASYLEGFEQYSPVTFNCVILTGSIINKNFDWNKHRGVKVARVLNEIAPNDQYVGYMPNNWFKILKKNELMGSSGVEGFSINSDILTQTENTIFTHNNVIKRDVIDTKWMPYLNVNKEAYRSEVFDWVYKTLKSE